jgi:hypothetical protein
MPVLDGPDPVEMVMQVEEAFHIVIPDEDAMQIRTVGELYAYVLARLPQPPSPACISSATFYRLRRGLRELLGIPRALIRPAARIEDLVPREGRPESWRRLAAALAPDRLPELVRPRWLEPWMPPCGLLTLLAFLLALGCGLAAGALGFPRGAIVAIAALGTLLCLFVETVVNHALYRLTAPYALDLPPGCVTVRDTVYTLVRSDPTRIVSETARAGDPEVWAILCSIVGPHLGVPSDALTPDRGFC